MWEAKPSPYPPEHIAFIRRISTDHPEWGEDRFATTSIAKPCARRSLASCKALSVIQTSALFESRSGALFESSCR